jgi:hypothetical protein
VGFLVNAHRSGPSNASVRSVVWVAEVLSALRRSSRLVLAMISSDWTDWR